ncbi:cyclin-like protein [Infundibulicybe gibba]|nr:cyclin-like protein [Infundibulicybe gibba]
MSTEPTAKKPLYEGSTQYRNWRYSPEAAVAVIRNTIEMGEPGSSSNVLFLTPDEELLLVKLYITKISQLCGHFRFPEEVEATAISYLKRFYLKNTVMDWHPKNVMLTALFLATKTTNNPISLETYTSHIPRTVASDVLDLEFLVAQSLGFEFAIWHSHRALWGIWLDLQNVPDRATTLPNTLYDAALNHVRASRLTDAELIYTPSQIALAALSLAAPDLASQWEQSKISPNGNDVLPAALDALRSLITAGSHLPNVDSVREVDRRLKLCKNPEKVAGSKAYLAKKAEEERKADDKRNRKAVETQKAMTDGDPFGNNLGGEKILGLVDYDDDDDDV